MNGDGTWENILPVIIIAIFMVANFFLRRRKTEKTENGKAISLLTEINQNLKIIEGFTCNVRIKKFMTGSWKRNNSQVGFLGEKLQNTLASTYSMVEECNRQIETAKQYKSSSYLVGIEVDRLREALIRSKQGLEEWAATNTDKKEMTPKKRSIFG